MEEVGETFTPGPEVKLAEEKRKERVARRERQDSLARYISCWWKGDAHVHSQESTRKEYDPRHLEGIYHIEEGMAYYEKLGLELVCFTEHASKPGSPQKLSPDDKICRSLLAEAERITQINRERKGDIIALSGVETNIFFDEAGQPTLDVPPEILDQLDLVIASRHAITREKEPKAIKESLIAAAQNPYVDVIGHPDRYTRKDGEQPPQYWQEYWDIWPEILEEMSKNHKAFEINFNNPPARKIVEMAAKAGLKFFLNYDAHDFNQYKKEQREIFETGEAAKKRWAQGELSEEEAKIMEEYKLERLSSGPGMRAILRLTRWLKRLEAMRVTPERIINSSQRNLLSFLTEDRGKETENLKSLSASSSSRAVE